MPKITASSTPSITVNSNPETASAETADSSHAATTQISGELTGLLPLARSSYEAIRLYHGTSPASRTSIREHGFSISAKQAGAMQVMINRRGLKNLRPGAVDQANSAHHLTAKKDLAREYAGAAGQGRALVRALIPDQDELDIRPDPFSTNDSGALITEQDIPASSVLGSKKEQSARGHEVLQYVMNAIVEESVDYSDEDLDERGLIRGDLRQVSADEARILLNEVQSDSDDDFR